MLLSNAVPLAGKAIVKSAPSLTYLSLKNCGLETVDFLNNLPQLRHLDLADNSIADISSLTVLKKLAHIDLSNNFINEAVAIYNFPQLQHLDLTGNKFVNALVSNSIYESRPNINFNDLEVIIGDYYYEKGKFDHALSYYYGTDVNNSKTLIQKGANTLSIYLSKLRGMGGKHEYFIKFYLFKCLEILNHNKFGRWFEDRRTELIEIVETLGVNYQQYIATNTDNGKLPYYNFMEEYVLYRNSGTTTDEHPEALFDYAITLGLNVDFNLQIAIYKQLVSLDSPFAPNLHKRIADRLRFQENNRKYYEKALAQPVDNKVIYFNYKSYIAPKPYVYVPKNIGTPRTAESGAELAIVLLIVCLILLLIIIYWLIRLFSMG